MSKICKGTVSQMTNWRKKITVKCVCGALEFDHWYTCITNLRNAERIPFRFIFFLKIIWPRLDRVSLKISCSFLTESSHDIVEYSRYIPCDCSHMRTAEIDLNSGAVMASKSFWVYRFSLSGRPIIYVCGDRCKVPVWRNPRYF